MTYQKINIEKDLIKSEFNCYSIEDRQKAILALLEMFELAKDNKKVYEGLKEFEKFIKISIESNKKKGLKSGKAKLFKTKSYLILKKGKLDQLKKTNPELFKKTTRDIFKYI
jgi:hypothetical protein|tara:strand:+ start:80 stop:415 length:336 start_codon:yes stop_codon:yes gene_type:complete